MTNNDNNDNNNTCGSLGSGAASKAWILNKTVLKKSLFFKPSYSLIHFLISGLGRGTFWLLGSPGLFWVLFCLKGTVTVVSSDHSCKDGIADSQWYPYNLYLIKHEFEIHYL